MSSAINTVHSSVYDVGATPDATSAHLSDACALLALMVQSQCTTQSSCKTDVDLDFKKLQELRQQLADAVQKAKDAASHSGFFGFLSSVLGSDIAQIAGAVAGIAAIIASGGAATPLILMSLSVAMEEGAKIGAKLGLDPKICAAISLASAALGMASGAGTGQALNMTAQGARDVQTAASVVKTGASATSIVLGGVAGYYKAQQMNHQADATGSHAQSDLTNTDLDSAIALLQSSLRTQQGETSTAYAYLANDSDTNIALSDRI